MKTEAGVRMFEAIANDVADLVLEFGGALSGEHGDGLVRSPFMRKMYGPSLYDAFRAIKQTFDPHGIFNPGKIVDAPPLTANLRYGAGYVDADIRPPISTTPSTAAWRAPSTCAAASAPAARSSPGRCVPSYMATLEEKHSTRGRANVLRLAMAGRLGEAGLGDAGRVRHARPVPRMPRVQGRMPGRRRHGAVQERVPGRLLERATAHRFDARMLGHVRRVAAHGQPSRAGVELARGHGAGPTPERTPARHRSAPHAARVSAADARAPARREPTSRARR